MIEHYVSGDRCCIDFRLSFLLHYWLHSHLTITPGSANFEILIKIIIKKNNKKSFWLNFCLNKECPKLLCGLDIGHRRRQTIPMWNSSGGILQGITVCLVTCLRY